jgi:hypothetical protein
MSSSEQTAVGQEIGGGIAILIARTAFHRRSRGRGAEPDKS